MESFTSYAGANIISNLPQELLEEAVEYLSTKKEFTDWVIDETQKQFKEYYKNK